MADLDFGDQVDGVSRSISTTPPSHYVVKIQSFPLFAKNGIEKFSSCEFEAGGYKWKLVLHPNGNKSKNVDDHISVYLMMVEGSSVTPPGWEVHAIFRFFLLDQNSDCYLVTQDDTAQRVRRFHQLKLEWGFDRLIPHKAFHNPSNGYVVNDTCVLGAEVYVCQEKVTGKGESLSMMKDSISYKHTWKIDNFSGLNNNVECEESGAFNVGDQKWKIQAYPKGKGSGAGNCISLYLALADPTALAPISQIHADFTLRILDQLNGRHYFGKANYWFSASNCFSGWPRFVSMNYFNLPSNGLLRNNTCIVEAEVSIDGLAKAL